MTKIYCDACSVELSNCKRVEVPHWIASDEAEVGGYMIASGGDFVRSNLKTTTVELCQKCYNKSFIGFMKVVGDINRESNA